MMICLLLLRQREFYNLRALVCKLFWKELSFALKLEVFFSPFAEFFRSFVVVSSSSSFFSFQQLFSAKSKIFFVLQEPFKRD